MRPDAPLAEKRLPESHLCVSLHFGLAIGLTVKEGLVLRFAIATVFPALCLCLAAIYGGVWAWLAVGYLSVLVFVLDQLVADEGAGQTDDTSGGTSEFPASDFLLFTISCLHIFILFLMLLKVSGAPDLSATDTVLTALGAGLFFGQVSHPAAHELIHRNDRVLRSLGRVMYTSLLVGHHASAHLRVHHVHVASDADPNSPRRGEGFYRYMLRASWQSFLAGWRAETRLRAGRDRSGITHPYVAHVGGALAVIALTGLTAGWPGLIMLGFLAGYAQVQILLSDYVQHYGLRRQALPDGRLEPVGPQHSWNAPHWFSSALMLNAPRHSDHHTSPNRPYPALRLDADAMPMLPYPVPLMAVLALMPTLWRRIMDPRCGRWRSAPLSSAT